MCTSGCLLALYGPLLLHAGVVGFGDMPCAATARSTGAEAAMYDHDVQHVEEGPSAAQPSALPDMQADVSDAEDAYPISTWSDDDGGAARPFWPLCLSAPSTCHKKHVLHYQCVQEHVTHCLLHAAVETMGNASDFVGSSSRVLPWTQDIEDPQHGSLAVPTNELLEDDLVFFTVLSTCSVTSKAAGRTCELCTSLQMHESATQKQC
jgi:hypothetical protein